MKQYSYLPAFQCHFHVIKMTNVEREAVHHSETPSNSGHDTQLAPLVSVLGAA